MSLEEQDAAIGRLVRQAAESKRHVAALRSELLNQAQSLSRLAQDLEAVAGRPEEAENALRRGELDQLLGKLPSAAALTELIDNIRRESEQYARLATDVSNLGL